MLSNHSYANGVEKWLDLSLQVATNLWLPVYHGRVGNRRGGRWPCCSDPSDGAKR